MIDFTYDAIVESGGTTASVMFRADSASGVALIGEDLFCTHFPHVKLNNKYKGILLNVDKSQVDGVQGTFQARLSVGDKKINCTVWVSGLKPILGKYAQRDLSVQIDRDTFTVKTVSNVNEAKDRFPKKHCPSVRNQPPDMLSRLLVYSEQMAQLDDDDDESTMTEGTLDN